MKKMKELEAYDGSQGYTDNPNNLILFNPPIGHEYGFKQDGLRYNKKYLSTMFKSKKVFNIYELEEYVDVMTWMNIDNIRFIMFQGMTCNLTENANLTSYGNAAYIALHCRNVEIKNMFVQILLDTGRVSL